MSSYVFLHQKFCFGFRFVMNLGFWICLSPLSRYQVWVSCVCDFLRTSCQKRWIRVHLASFFALHVLNRFDNLWWFLWWFWIPTVDACYNVATQVAMHVILRAGRSGRRASLNADQMPMLAQRKQRGNPTVWNDAYRNMTDIWQTFQYEDFPRLFLTYRSYRGRNE